MSLCFREMIFSISLLIYSSEFMQLWSCTPKIHNLKQFPKKSYGPPFGEGNTRTTAVFTIKYLQSFGFEVKNDMFKEHSWYFRNALVRANYNNYPKRISATDEYLVLFFQNLILGENNELKNLNANWLVPLTR